LTYEDIVGQEEAKGRLRAMVNEQRVPHALLFTGREGSGNLPAALAFAQHLFCQAPSREGPCGTCHSCQKVAKLAHPDFHLVFPIIKSKTVTSSDALVSEFREALLDNPYLTIQQWTNEMDAGNKQPVIPVEEASSILRKLSYTSYEGSYKVMVIWQPEKMNAESANRLLKILEEPPEKTVFVLVTSQADQLMATIMSRVQQVPFYGSSDQAITEALVKRFKVTATAAAQAATLADGNYAEAVSYLSENDHDVSLLQHFTAFMRLAIKFECGRALQWIEENAATGREKQKQFLLYALNVFRDSLMFSFGERSLVKMSGEERQFLEKFAPYVSQNYEQLVEEFNSSYYYIERNANPKILFMDLLLRTGELLKR
jgi:DNA polymerase III subunit delta'